MFVRPGQCPAPARAGGSKGEPARRKLRTGLAPARRVPARLPGLAQARSGLRIPAQVQTEQKLGQTSEQAARLDSKRPESEQIVCSEAREALKAQLSC